MSVREYFDKHIKHTNELAAAILTLAEVIGDASTQHVVSIDTVAQSIDNISDAISSLGPVEIVVHQ